MPSTFDIFEKKKFSNITILEIFSENVTFLKTKFSNTDIYIIIHGDIRDVEKFNLEKFDFIFFGTALIFYQEKILPKRWKNLKLCKKLVVLGNAVWAVPKR